MLRRKKYPCSLVSFRDVKSERSRSSKRESLTRSQSDAGGLSCIAIATRKLVASGPNSLDEIKLPPARRKRVRPTGRDKIGPTSASNFSWSIRSTHAARGTFDNFPLSKSHQFSFPENLRADSQGPLATRCTKMNLSS